MSEYPIVRHDGIRWMRVEEAPCPLCAIWPGPHDHSIHDDGRLGPLVVKAGHDLHDAARIIRTALDDTA